MKARYQHSLVQFVGKQSPSQNLQLTLRAEQPLFLMTYLLVLQAHHTERFIAHVEMETTTSSVIFLLETRRQSMLTILAMMSLVLLLLMKQNQFHSQCLQLRSVPLSKDAFSLTEEDLILHVYSSASLYNQTHLAHLIILM